jgi:hypothetical protein
MAGHVKIGANSMIGEHLEEGCHGFLPKPFNLSDLYQQIHQGMH